MAVGIEGRAEVIDKAMKATARRMRRLMDDRDIKPKDLAEYLGLSLSNVYIILRGEQALAIEHGKKVAILLGITLDQLYDEREEIPVFMTLPNGVSKEEVKADEVDQSDTELRAFLEKELTGAYARGTGDKSELREVVINEIVKYFKLHPEEDPRGKKPKE